MQDAPEGPVAIAFPDSLILNILLRRLLADMSANSPASQAQTCSHICRYAHKTGSLFLMPARSRKEDGFSVYETVYETVYENIAAGNSVSTQKGYIPKAAETE